MKLIFAALLLLWALPSFALTPVESITSTSGIDGLWSLFVGGEKSVPIRLVDLDKWSSAQAQCRPKTQLMLNKLATYGEVAYDSDSTRSTQLQKDMQQMLSDISVKDPGCFQDVSASYLMGSLWVFNRWAASNQSALANGTGCTTHCEGVPQHLFLLLLTQALIKANAIEFHVPNHCAIEFAYLCRSSAIKLNPLTLPLSQGGLYGGSPQDFAGHYLHELNHLFRDKYVSADYVRSHFYDAKDSGQIDWKNYLLVDETLAKVMAGTFEIGNIEKDSFDRKGPNRILNDLSLFIQGGPLERLYEAESFGGEPDVVTLYSQFLNTIFLRQTGNEFSEEHLLSSSEWSDLADVYSNLRSGYFKGDDKKITASDLQDAKSSLNPENQSLEFDPLTILLSKRAWGITPFTDTKKFSIPESDVWRMKSRLSMSVGPFSFGIGKAKASEFAIPMQQYLAVISDLVGKIKAEPTPVCAALDTEFAGAIAHASSGEDPVSKYFGLSCAISAVPENGSRTDIPGQTENGSRTDDPRETENGSRTDDFGRP